MWHKIATAVLSVAHFFNVAKNEAVASGDLPARKRCDRNVRSKAGNIHGESGEWLVEKLRDGSRAARNTQLKFQRVLKNVPL
jgi:hypothetical protein